jgi:hypothetical protein
MRRSALVTVMVAALLVGAVAKADETAPPIAPAAPSPGATQASPPVVGQTPPPVVPQTTPPVAAQAPPPAAVKTPPSAVQSVAPEAAEAILGQRVTDPEGKDIGRLVDVLVDAQGEPQAAVIDFGGFMGVGNRKIAVQWSALRFNPGNPKRKITLEMTPDQIKAAPEFLNPNKAAPVVTPAATSATSP